MRKIIITITNEDSEVLDSITLEIPETHITIGIRSYDTMFSSSGLDIDTLYLGKKS